MLGVGRAVRKNRLNEVWKTTLNAMGSPKKISQGYFRFLSQESRSIITETETCALERNYLEEPNRTDIAGKTETCQTHRKTLPTC